MPLSYTWGAAAPKDTNTPASSSDKRELARWPAPGLVALTVWSASGIFGCNTARRTQDSTAPAPEATSVATQPLREQPAAGTGGQPAPAVGGTTSVAPSIADRPSVDDNMGRGFQGTLAFRLVGPQQSYGLRYSSRGNTARLQVDPLEAKDKSASRHLDALIWGGNISLLNHRDRTLHTVQLDTISPQGDDAEGVEIQKTGDRNTLLGVGCERYEMKDGPLRISACVGALPGTFEVDKLEAVARIDVPAWVENLLKDELLPLQGSVRGAGGGELHSFELIEYSPGPVDASQLTMPANYRVISPGAANPG